MSITKSKYKIATCHDVDTYMVSQKKPGRKFGRVPQLLKDCHLIDNETLSTSYKKHGAEKLFGNIENFQCTKITADGKAQVLTHDEFVQLFNKEMTYSEFTEMTFGIKPIILT